MNWTRFTLTILAAGIGASLTDWLFSGVLFHDKYSAHPEVWRRPQGGQGETRAVLWAVGMGFFTCAFFVFTCSYLSIYHYEATLSIALFMWLTVSVPLLISNALFIKLHPLIVVAHSLSWLAKLIIAAIAVSLILH